MNVLIYIFAVIGFLSVVGTAGILLAAWLNFDRLVHDDKDEA